MSNTKLAIQDLAKSIGKNGCLAFVYANIVECINNEGWNPENFACKMKLFADVFDGIESKLLEEDCYVNDAEKYMHYLDNSHKYSVTKKDITSLSEVANSMGAVYFEYNGEGHWVGYAMGQIVFDSVTDSVCRKYGQPTKARIVTVIE